MIAILISVSVLLGGQNTKQKDFDKIEAVNSIEDMIEWMQWDIKNQDVETQDVENYVENLNDILILINKEDVK